MAVDCGSGRGVTGLSGRGLTGGGGARVWWLIRGTAIGRRRGGVRLVLVSKMDSNGGVAHRRTKKVVRGGAPAARTRARPRRREEVWRCSGFGDRGTTGSVSVMPGRRRPTTVWRGASTAAEMKWLGGEGAVAPARSSGGSDELEELHGSWAQR
jgi:hypothetical protein